MGSVAPMLRAMRTALLCLIAVAAAAGEISEKPVDYRHGEVALRGLFARPAGDAVVPGVLVVHEWYGHNPFAQRRARELAQQGYAAFACDIYGAGVLAKDRAEASSMAKGFYADRALLRARAKAGLDALRAQAGVDGARLAALGFCFGGTTSLELARSGEPLAGVISFHGGLGTEMPAQAGAAKARILVLHGAADPFVPPAQVAGFMDEMNKAGADYRLIAYSGAVHGFTNPDNGTDAGKGAAYHAPTELAAFAAAHDFLRTIFAK